MNPMMIRRCVRKIDSQKKKAGLYSRWRNAVSCTKRVDRFCSRSRRIGISIRKKRIGVPSGHNPTSHCAVVEISLYSSSTCVSHSIERSARRKRRVELC